MDQKVIYKTSLCAFVLCSSLQLQADENIPKRTLKSNYQEVYTNAPKSVTTFTDMLQEGKLYGRLRSNTFYYKWQQENNSQQNHLASGLGGSLIFQSAKFKDFNFKTGLYYSHGMFSTKNSDVTKLKAGNDVLSRFEYLNSGTKDLAVLGQAYIAYSGIKDTNIKLGRQLVETFFTKSNDTKMIPNTFDALVFNNKSLPQTDLSVGYLAWQKLRDHADGHSVLMYDNHDAANFSKYDGNDDTAMHKGLTYTALKAAGKPTDAPLIVVDLHNKSVNNLKIDAAYYAVPQLISEAMVEGNYKIALNKEFSLSPGVRYIKQFDLGAGDVGGAAYDGTPTGYKDATSLNSQMIAAKVVAAYKNYKLNLGYTNVLDEADLITPWRGFPTAGYTRSMARYNWVANTKSYRLELQINANKTGIYKDLFVQTSILHTDADESKGQYDENYYYIGFVQNIPSLPQLQWRYRLGYADTKKPNADNLDTRFELNYLF